MNFLNPFFLFGLVAVAVPVVIHLINLQRPKRVSFSTLAFFNELRKSTIRRIRIKKYLLMTLRVLALLFLALALARPVLPPTLSGSANSTSPKAVAIIIDNSASMSRVSEQGVLVDRAKNIAGRIIKNGNSDNKFYIVSTNGESAGNAQFVSGMQAQEKLSEIESSNMAQYSAETIRTAVSRVKETPQSQATIYIISDGQVSQFEGVGEITNENNAGDSKSITVQPIQLPAGNQQNVAVASVKLRNQIVSEGSPVTMSVALENTGNVAAANQYVSMEVGGEIIGQHEVSLQPGEKKEVPFQLVPDKSGHITGRIVLEGDEISYDNERYFVLNIPQKRSILLINNESKRSSFDSYLSPALEAAAQTNTQLTFEQKTVSEVSRSDFTDYDAVIFNGIDGIPEYWFQNIQRYVQEGGGVLFFPSEKGDINNYNQFLSLFNAPEFSNVMGEYGSFQAITKMGALAEGHPVLDELFTKKKDEDLKVERSSIFYYFRLTDERDSISINLLETAEGHPLLTEQPFGDGMLLISTLGTDPGWSNIPVNPLFAPFYYRTVLYASSTERAGLQEHTLGKPFVWETIMEATESKLMLNKTEYKPELQRQMDGMQIRYAAKEWKPGILTVTAGGNDQKIAVNKNIMESRFDTLTNKNWQQMLGDKLSVNEIINADSLSYDDLESKLSATMFGKEIWNWFIWIALLFLTLETAVTRLYKAESIS